MMAISVGRTHFALQFWSADMVMNSLFLIRSYRPFEGLVDLIGTPKALKLLKIRIEDESAYQRDDFWSGSWHYFIYG